MTRSLLLALVLAPAALLTAQYGSSPHTWWNASTGEILPWDEDYADASGQVGIRNTTGAIRTAGHAFFEALGTNGRACITCHQPSNAMGLSAAIVRQRWTETNGKDPVFAAIDGSNCPDLPQEDKASHSLLLDRGLFRIPLPLPKNAEFEIEVVSDPTGCNTSAAYGLRSTHPTISVFRRPRIAANFNSVAAPGENFALMADGREPSLRTQAISAALIHEQATGAPSEDKLKQIVEFESQIYTAQSSDARGGLLYEEHGPFLLGPDILAHPQRGRVDSASGDVWSSFDAWANSAAQFGIGVQSEFRASAARGSRIFAARCVNCHTNLTHEIAETPKDLPLFKITCTNKVVYTSDPGRALTTGKCEDIGVINIQQLRGLSARAPYFSGGSAGTLRDVVDYYDRKLHIGFTEQQKSDLINFVSVL